eukprot:3111515-Pyramimonas_sp.AAC.1
MELVDQKNKYPPNYLARNRTIQDEHASRETEQWKPWQEMANKFGEDALLEMISANTAQARPNEKLPPNTETPWPKNLEVLLVEETKDK